MNRSSRSRSRERRGDRDYDRGSRSDRKYDRSPSPDDNDGTTLYVAQLSYQTTGEDLQERFAVFGTVMKAEIMRDPYTKDSRGFGFVTMKTKDAADEAASKMNGAQVGGRAIRCEISRRKGGHRRTPGQYMGPSAARSKGYRGGGPANNRDDYGSRGGGRGDYDYGPRGGPRGGGGGPPMSGPPAGGYYEEPPIRGGPPPPSYSGDVPAGREYGGGGGGGRYPASYPDEPRRGRGGSYSSYDMPPSASSYESRPVSGRPMPGTPSWDKGDSYSKRGEYARDDWRGSRDGGDRYSGDRYSGERNYGSGGGRY